MTGSEATTKHKVTLDPICTPPAREESLDGQARCLRLGSLCWWVGSVLVRYGGCVGRDSGNNAWKERACLGFFGSPGFYFSFDISQGVIGSIRILAAHLQ